MSSHYTRYLKYFTGQNTYQLFGDKKDLPAKILHNPTPGELMRLNKLGYGVFLTVNETDGKGRAKKNISRVRAVFADMDGEPITGMMDDMPHLVVESSPGKFHGYWFVDDKFPLGGFKPVQKAIIHKYNADKACHDLPRVLRVPGFYHQKAEPTPVNVVFENTDITPISYNEAVEKWPPVPVKKWSAPKYKEKSDGEGFDVGKNVYELLEKYGWKRLYGPYWTRPGKDHGKSGWIMSDTAIYIYTDGTCLEPNKVSDCFELMAKYEYGGDKKACARDILEKRKNV